MLIPRFDGQGRDRRPSHFRRRYDHWPTSGAAKIIMDAFDAHGSRPLLEDAPLRIRSQARGMALRLKTGRVPGKIEIRGESSAVLTRDHGLNGDWTGCTGPLPMNETQTHFVAVAPIARPTLRIRRVFVGQQVQCKHCKEKFAARETDDPGTVGSVEAAGIRSRHRRRRSGSW